MKSKRLVFVVGAIAVVLSPVLASAISTTANTTINATVASAISMTTSTTVAIAVIPTGSGVASSAGDIVSVATNNSTGYNLTLSDTSTVTNLVNGANTIAAHAGTFAAPTTLANNSWGYRVDNSGTFGAGPTSAQSNVASLPLTWAGVPSSASPQLLKTTAAVAAADVTNVWYGVKVDTTKTNGTYTTNVTYTATTNP